MAIVSNLSNTCIFSPFPYLYNVSQIVGKVKNGTKMITE